MFSNKKLLLLFFLCFCFQSNYSQVHKTEKDSTDDMYAKIHNYSKKNNFNKRVYRLFFKTKKAKKKEELLVQTDTINYNGKIIRKINIITLDPFGHSVVDTTAVPNLWSEKMGNKLHLKTTKIAIYNLLLIKKNTVYDSYKIQESERLIRAQRYVTAVKISKELTSKESDSVDVTIRVLDSWSTIPRFSISSNKVSIGVKEKDFLGTGQQLDYRFTNRFEDGKNAHEIDYSIPNIKNSFIGTMLHYNRDLDDNYSKSIDVERAFYSPLTKWAGGIYAGQVFKRDTLQGPDLEYSKQRFKYNFADSWAGKSTKLFTDVNDERTNLIITGRFLNVDYIENPTEIYDPTHFYSDEKLFLSGIGINKRGFIKDSYIFRNGMTEDVPIGKIYGLTFGYQHKNSTWRRYLGGQFSFGNYYRLGFLSMNFEAGSFFNNSKTYETSFIVEANYFTKLYSLGQWRLRQFINPKVVIGINHQNIIGDNININEDNGLAGFNAALYGTDKMIIALQTQTYSPNDVWGFRLNPFFNYSAAVLGSPNNTMIKSKAYSKLTVGVLINNDYLVFSSFLISLSFYPHIPLEGNNIFKTNTYSNSDYGLQSFELAKPRIAAYQ